MNNISSQNFHRSVNKLTMSKLDEINCNEVHYSGKWNNKMNQNTTLHNKSLNCYKTTKSSSSTVHKHYRQWTVTAAENDVLVVFEFILLLHEIIISFCFILKLKI